MNSNQAYPSDVVPISKIVRFQGPKSIQIGEFQGPNVNQPDKKILGPYNFPAKMFCPECSFLRP